MFVNPGVRALALPGLHVTWNSEKQPLAPLPTSRPLLAPGFASCSTPVAAAHAPASLLLTAHTPAFLFLHLEPGRKGSLFPL